MVFTTIAHRNALNDIGKKDSKKQKVLKCLSYVRFFGHIFNPLFLMAQNYLHTSIRLYGLASDESRDTSGSRRTKQRTPSCL